MSAKKVLITGVCGLIAGAIYRRLCADPERYEVYALARRAVPSERATNEPLDIPEDRFTVVDMADLDSVEAAFEGMDTIVHMAADPRPDASWDNLLQSNVIGAYNAFEAANRSGVRRVVYASSIMVSWGYQTDEPFCKLAEGRFDEINREDIPIITHESVTRPTGLYPATKIWGEALARSYADTQGLSALCLRIGWVNAEDSPQKPEAGPFWCSQRDVVQLAERAINASPDLKFDVFYGVSDNKWRWVDTDHARDVLGYEPQDSAEVVLGL